MSRSSAKNVSNPEFNKGLCEFIDRSPSPFHACSAIASMLEAAGFHRLNEVEDWQIDSGEKYYVTRNDSSIVAFIVGKEPLLHEVGLRGLGAHTDSPALKVKPEPDIFEHHCWRLGVEIYGGMLLNPWFDRDLSLAGRVHYRDRAGVVRSSLIDFKCPIGTVPNLAIHLDREANKNRSINQQTQMPVLVSTFDEQPGGFSQLLLEQLQRQFEAQGLSNDIDEVLDHEMYFYDTQKAELIGLHGDFIAAARLDNLLSCFVNTQVMCSLDAEHWSVMVCNDHEEVGSQSAAGAAGPFLKNVLERLSGSHAESLTRCLQRSTFISVDNAHALHPSHPDKMDKNHSPRINGGPVIKVNATQRYASNGETQAIFRAACNDERVPVQEFVMRSDLRCGSTIGPITATELGVKTLDVGAPTYAMHSIRELAGSEDPLHLYKALRRFMSVR